MIIMVLIGGSIGWFVGCQLGWRSGRQRFPNLGAQPWNWRIFLGPVVYMNWDERRSANEDREMPGQ